MDVLTQKLLDDLWPKAPKILTHGMVAKAPHDLAVAEIKSALRLAHFMAQLSHESRAGRSLRENLNYSTAARIMAVWPKLFPTLEEAEPFVKHPKELAGKVYNGRLGNRPDTDDGWNYRGRGLIQITGRDGYVRMGKATKLDLVSHPDLATGSDHVLAIACAYWMSRKINPAADADDIVKVTKLVNGGTNGLADRSKWLTQWKKALGIGP